MRICTSYNVEEKLNMKRFIYYLCLSLCLATPSVNATNKYKKDYKHKHKQHLKSRHKFSLHTLAPPLELIEMRVFNEVNDVRATNNLPKLIINPYLSIIAEKHSQNIALGIVPVGHAGFAERSNTINYNMPYAKLAENVGWNIRSPDPVVSAIRGWIHSPHHYANILDSFTSTGVGVAIDGQGRYIFTQIFWKK